jgi:hypothetical protein
MCPGMLAGAVIIMEDSACVSVDHTDRTQSLNLSPHDFHIFIPVKKGLEVFGSDKNVKSVVLQWFWQHQWKISVKRIHQLVQQ